MNSQELATVFVPVVTGVVGALGIVFQAWLGRRSQAAQRRLAFEDAIRQVGFAEQWWKARASMDPSPSAVQSTTAIALAQVDNAYHLIGSLDPPRGVRDPRPVFTELFLLYGLTRPAAKVLRVVYFLLLASLYVIALSILGNLLAGDKQYTTRDSLAYQLIASAFIGSVALVIRAVAQSMEARRRTSGDIAETTAQEDGS